MKRILILLLALALCIPAAVLADPLPLDLTGGAPYTVKYSSDLEVYDSCTIGLLSSFVRTCGKNTAFS